jgi:hypothetical protein
MNLSTSSLPGDCGSCETDKRIAMELRKQNRYKLNAPVHFMWAPHDGEPQGGQGITRDINTFGVYVMTDALPSVGARVQMEIALPALRDAGSGMQLTCEGVVLRCDYDDATKRGFAASAQFYPETTDMVLSQLKIPGQPI